MMLQPLNIESDVPKNQLVNDLLSSARNIAQLNEESAKHHEKLENQHNIATNHNHTFLSTRGITPTVFQTGVDETSSEQG